MKTMTAHFQPQLSQQDLAEMIDREGLHSDFRIENGEWYPIEHSHKAPGYVESGYLIRITPGALTEFGLKPVLRPHNPDGLRAEQITQGGEYRAMVSGEILPERYQFWFLRDQQWLQGAFPGAQVNGEMNFGETFRVPVNQPFQF